MFKKSETIPQRNKFSFTPGQIIEDVEAVYRCEDQRSKLYFCLDKVPPKEHQFEKMEEFLKGTQDLEKCSNMLNHLKCEVENLQKELVTKVTILRRGADES